jgi:hypothetical protein
VATAFPLREISNPSVPKDNTKWASPYELILPVFNSRLAETDAFSEAGSFDVLLMAGGNFRGNPNQNLNGDWLAFPHRRLEFPTAKR